MMKDLNLKKNDNQDWETIYFIANFASELAKMQN